MQEFLWNHQATVSSFTLYESPTLELQPDQPGPNSKLCLSCHDGTVAVDSFSGRQGSVFISGNALIGTDLSNDHPVGIQWDHQGISGYCSRCHSVPDGPIINSPVPFFNGKIECATCHDAHNLAGLPYFLRVSMQGSELCMVCHDE